MELRQLKYFKQAFANLPKTFSEADPGTLHISQSTLSQQIKQLEN